MTTPPTIISYRCEHDFWNNPFLASSVDEPVSAASGLLIVAFAVFGDGGLRDPPLQFCMARASLAFCGLGTCAFHILSTDMMRSSHSNGNLYDGVSMAVFTSNVFLLYLNNYMNKHKMIPSLLCMLYMFFWIATNDSDMFTYLSSEITDGHGTPLLSMGVQYPLFVMAYVYIMGRIVCVYGSRTISLHAPMWIALVVAIAGWIPYEFACSGAKWVFFGHAVWHVGIGFVAIHLVFIGAEMTYDLERVTGCSGWWPKFQASAESQQLPQPRNKLYSKLPSFTIPSEFLL